MSLPTLRLSKEELADFETAIHKEWLVTNGLGGYASGTALGINTRKYHALLCAALHPPGDRTVCVAKVEEAVTVGNRVYPLGANDFGDVIYPEGYRTLQEFSISPCPTFTYAVDRVDFKKTVFMPHEKNVAVVLYSVQNISASPISVVVTPLVTCRHFHQVASRTSSFTQNQVGDHEVQLSFGDPRAVIALRTTEGEFHEKPNWINRLFYREEDTRGESCREDCYQPGYLEIAVPANASKDFAVLATASLNGLQNTETMNALANSTADAYNLLDLEIKRRNYILDLCCGTLSSTVQPDWLSWALLAADSFLVEGFSGSRSVIAGYHWFEAWGRDTFISLPGLMLVTQRFGEAREVLLGFNRFCTLGLIPNFLSDLSQVPSCNTVDATMWYLNAVLQYLKYTGDFEWVRVELWDSLKEIVENHVAGTSFGIRVEDDGLLAHGERLTWMDAEVGGVAVTPRAGKAVEIQALWYNALRSMELLATKFSEPKLAESYALFADKAKLSFGKKFWNNKENCLFDVLTDSGADNSIRPNQVFAVSLDFTMLDPARSAKVVERLQRDLLTPCGLRTLAQNDPKYRGTYVGDRATRDSTYHNGTVWPWLLGPFTKAYLKTKGYTPQNADFALQNFIEPLFAVQVKQAGLGSVSEIFDGDPPHTPRGCISQAWSIAEPLRAFVEDVLQSRPKHERDLA
jgi:predicted glycogen debranching enzyme